MASIENGGSGSGGGCGGTSASSTDAIHDNEQVYMQKFRLYETRSVTFFSVIYFIFQLLLRSLL